MNDLAHLHPDFRHVMNLSDQERMAFINQPRWIGYTAANQILAALNELVEQPKKPRMLNLLLVGEPNNGKTTIVRHFHEQYYKATEDEHPEGFKPIILAESPPTADEKGLYVSILERFFTPYRISDPTVKLRYQVIHLCRVCKVKMLIIDEFHSLLAGSAIKQRELMNAIKLLCNELMIPIVAVGTTEAVRVLHTDPQHASRFDVKTLPAWKLDNEFAKLVLSFERILPLKRPSSLRTAECIQLLHAISGGNLGNLQRLLSTCAIAAIKDGSEQVSRNLIELHMWLRPTNGLRETMR
ncbi:TniB family NTP-binding protein [Aeromonas caviae]|uniref:TniB family NTP-binding protein n=1 Tax=Aeromonas caviae TaxID=648 RepID=UPI0029D591C1|nr:TniB family NTP-binding protein [Aeromonas caviae]MDX7893485.1 TniB family NTP-binding protein [Aeromonas caviae]MDY7799508.1 TniB family NTP-binding protein [Aeromonas caviae]